MTPASFRYFPAEGKKVPSGELDPSGGVSPINRTRKGCRWFQKFWGRLGLLGRAEHAGGYPGDQAARYEALGLRAQIVAKARNDIAFASGQGFQAGSGDLLGGLLGPLQGEVLLASGNVKLRFSGARAERTNPDAVGLHFLGEALGEEQVEGFSGGVGADVGDGLEGGGRRENEDVAAMAGDHIGQKQAREMDNRRAVNLNHIEKPLRWSLRKFAILAEAGVIDEQVDGEALLPGEIVNFRRRIRLGQIGDEGLSLDFMGVSQFASELAESIPAARG